MKKSCFYLQSRGITLRASKNDFIKSFINEIIDDISDVNPN